MINTYRWFDTADYYTRRRQIRLGVVAVVLVIGISVAWLSQRIDTTSASYGAGQSVGQQWAQVYGAMTSDPAISSFRQGQCQSMELAAGQVDRNDFMAGCESAITARLGPAK